MNVAERLRDLPGLDEAPSRWGADPAFWTNGREIVHFHEGGVEIRLTRKLIRELDDERPIERTRTSDWVVVPCEEEDLIVQLAKRAIEANR
jgi:Family of unknown function (DUF5519)